MSKFKVGDRARIVKTHEYKHLIGAECRIIGECYEDGDECWDIAAIGEDDWYMTKAHANECLEPILYDGAQPSEFSYSELIDNLRTKVQEEV